MNQELMTLDFWQDTVIYGAKHSLSARLTVMH